jgi:hypothetical protein
MRIELCFIRLVMICNMEDSELCLAKQSLEISSISKFFAKEKAADIFGGMFCKIYFPKLIFRDKKKK